MAIMASRWSVEVLLGPCVYEDTPIARMYDCRTIIVDIRATSLVSTQIVLHGVSVQACISIHWTISFSWKHSKQFRIILGAWTSADNFYRPVFISRKCRFPFPEPRLQSWFSLIYCPYARSFQTWRNTTLTRMTQSMTAMTSCGACKCDSESWCVFNEHSK